MAGNKNSGRRKSFVDGVGFARTIRSNSSEAGVGPSLTKTPYQQWMDSVISGGGTGSDVRFMQKINKVKDRR